MKKLWRGEQPLGRAFWVYFVLIWVGSMILEVAVHGVLQSFGSMSPGLPLLVVVNFLYPFFAAIGVWKSANAYEKPDFYPTAAKVSVCVILAPIVWYLANGGVPEIAQALVSW